MSMISDGAFSIFKRFSAREKSFHEMPEGGECLIFGGGGSIKDLRFKLYTFYIQIRFKEHTRVQVSIHRLRRHSTCFYDWAADRVAAPAVVSRAC